MTGTDSIGEARAAQASPRPIRIDLHSHTRYSPDSRLEPAELIEAAAATGLDRIAVTDHNEIDGALEAKMLDPGRVVVGEEIRCRGRTELIGLFLTERIPPGLSVEETADRIRDQGGIVYAPHPFAYLLRPVQRGRRLLEAADIVEAFNARAFAPMWNERCTRAATRAGIPVGAGSDAHFRREIGRAWTEMPAFAGAADFRSSLPHARPVGRTVSHAALHVATAGLKAARLVTGGFTRPGRRSLPADAAAGRDAPVAADAGARAPPAVAEVGHRHASVRG